MQPSSEVRSRRAGWDLPPLERAPWRRAALDRGGRTPARVDKVVVPGTAPEGEDAVTNNAWLVGNDHEVLVIDPRHHPDVVAAIGSRWVTAIVLTHGHHEHIESAVALREATGAPIWFNPADMMLWNDVHRDARPDQRLGHCTLLEVAGTRIVSLYTPGHTPGSTCLYVHELNTVFTGATLLRGGPGATGRSYSDAVTIVRSIRSQLLTLPGCTVVRTGQGDDTTITAEAAHIA